MNNKILLIILLTCSSLLNASDSDLLFKELSRLAESESSEAKYHLGMFYNNGIGTEKNPKKAFELFKESARLGDPLGSYKVGCYYSGQFKDVVNVDEVKALKYKMVAAQAGYSLAQNDVAVKYYKAGDFKNAEIWWEKSAGQGDFNSIYNLFSLYSNEEGVLLNNVKAYGYLIILGKYASEEQLDKVNELLQDLRSKLSKAQINEAEHFGMNWTSNPTALTTRAKNGIYETEAFVKNNRKI